MWDVRTYTLLTTAVLTALVHTLIPDHWLPFVLIGRARGWSLRMAALVSGLSALIHALLSVALGLFALAIGLKSAEVVGETLERAGAALLILFGLVYAGWAWHKRGHFHPGGTLLHRRDELGACNGREGHGHPEHLHYHADQNLIQGRVKLSAVSLAVVVGANPCVLVMPIVLATAREGLRAVALVALAYTLAAVVLMAGLSVLGVAGSRRIRPPGAARHMEWVSGLMIAVVGMLFWLLEG